jgi:CDP-glucose 4,6-dehydratase
VRPWQHVLDCLNGYLIYVEQLAADRNGTLPRAINFGPHTSERLTVDELVASFFENYGQSPGVTYAPASASIEMQTLALDASLAEAALRWRCALSQHDAVAWTALWSREAADIGAAPDAIRALMAKQIAAFSTTIETLGRKKAPSPATAAGH